MATATATATLTDIRSTWADSKYHVIASIAISANPATYATGGLVCNLEIPLIKASRAPLYGQIAGQSGFVYVWVPGTDASNGKIKIFVQDAVAANPLAEMANALAIPAGVSGDTIQGFFVFYGME